jgi:AcrR family transcriptional regulator
VSEATVFTYFHGKRELCVRVITDWYDEIIATIGRAAAHRVGAGPARLVRAHPLAACSWCRALGCVRWCCPKDAARDRISATTLMPLQRRYTAPLMDLLARGQASGEFRADLPLRLLRPLVLGPMEHILWEAWRKGPRRLSRARQSTSMSTATAVSAMLWGAAGAGAELAALRALRADIGGRAAAQRLSTAYARLGTTVACRRLLQPALQRGTGHETQAPRGDHAQAVGHR